MNKVDIVEASRLRKDIPPFRAGDQVKVHVKVSEGGRDRIQVFEGVVIARRGGGLRESFTVRKLSFGVGVERTFPLHAPVIGKLEVVRHGKVRRAKLYYLRGLTGRRAKIEERRGRIPTWDGPDGADDEAPEEDAPADAAQADAAQADAAQADAVDEPAAEAAAGEPAAEPAAEAAVEDPADEPADTPEPEDARA